MEGKIIAVEGLDGAGKATQTKKLVERLEKEGKKVVYCDFPHYNDKSSWLVREYLSGEFGDDYKKVDPRMASVFYAVDRLITYRDKIKSLYEDGYIVVFDRWTTANMLHQSMKAETSDKVDEIVNWIEKLEYESFGLPKPDMTIFLKVPYEYSFETLKSKDKNDGSIKQDIHERNIEFLKRSYENGVYVSDKYDWKVIECFEDKMRSIDSIHEELYGLVSNLVK